ncbi:MAG: hypothetical protein FWF70_04105 [Bacteroidetes bacterium]|nr:hypothetical protein [Bacteroidota bacterium]MCL1968977.1 hypothetical protein [Bacteroidota bacterium]
MKKTAVTIFAILFLAIPFLSFGQKETSTDEKTKTECKFSYALINEYGFFAGGSVGFTGIFVNGIRFNKTQDVIGLGVGYEVDTKPSSSSYYRDFESKSVENAQSIPIFVNYRHYFPGKRALKPLVNFAIGTRINFWKEYYYYYEPWWEYPDLYPRQYTKESQEVNAGLYGTIAAGFKVKAFSFTSGFFLKSWNKEYFGGVEVKVGYTF